MEGASMEGASEDVEDGAVCEMVKYGFVNWFSLSSDSAADSGRNGLL